MIIRKTTYQTYQVIDTADGHMIIEAANYAVCEAFIADPVRYGYGLIGGPK